MGENYSMDYNSFYESLKYHLDKKGYGGQAMISRHTAIPRSYISRILKKDRRAGSRTQKKIARFFGYSLEEFVEIGRRIILGEDPEQNTDLFKDLPEEHLIQRLTDAVRKELQTAQLLDQTLRLYENIVEKSKELIVRFDDHMNITFVNRACEKMTGLERQKLLRQKLQDLIDVNYRETLTNSVSNLDKNEGSFSIELPASFSGKWLYLTVTVFPEETVGKDKGQMVGFDITEKKKLHDRLKFIQHGVEMSYVPTLWISDKAEIVYVNNAVCKLLGYTESELKQMHVWDINPLIPREDWPGKWAWFQSKEKVVFSGQYRTKDDTIIPVEFQVSNLKYPDGRRYNVVFVKTLSNE